MLGIAVCVCFGVGCEGWFRRKVIFASFFLMSFEEVINLSNTSSRFLLPILVLFFFFGRAQYYSVCVCFRDGPRFCVSGFFMLLEVGLFVSKSLSLSSKLVEVVLFLLTIAACVMEGIKVLNMSLPSAIIFEFFYRLPGCSGCVQKLL